MAFVFPVHGRPTSEGISKRISLTSHPAPSKHGRTVWTWQARGADVVNGIRISSKHQRVNALRFFLFII